MGNLFISLVLGLFWQLWSSETSDLGFQQNCTLGNNMVTWAISGFTGLVQLEHRKVVSARMLYTCTGNDVGLKWFFMTTGTFFILTIL